MGTSTGVQNLVADVFSRNPVGNMDGSQISCAALRALALNSRGQLIREQREDPEDHSPLQVPHINQIDTRQRKPPTEGSRQGASVQYDRTRETRTIPSGGNSAAERRPVRSRQATAVRPCPYYLRSRLKKSEGIPEEQRSNGIDSIPQNNLRRRSLSMEALDGDPVDRSE
ncbi:uncharacterized protein TNCV_4561481 [Trichonephila clavipes]|nr:uncharacterized protein TNCV_4561481 [Trichonephila clavipes]